MTASVFRGSAAHIPHLLCGFFSSAPRRGVRNFPAPMQQRGSVLLMLLVMAGAACGSDELPARHAEPRMRRLLAKQYINSVRQLLGPVAAAGAKPPPDIASLGFDSIGASELTPG